MLVLSRKVGESILISGSIRVSGESILISESIRVTVVQAANGRIRLGIDAPPKVKVLREELTRSGFHLHSSPSKNGKAEALSPAAQLP